MTVKTLITALAFTAVAGSAFAMPIGAHISPSDAVPVVTVAGNGNAAQMQAKKAEMQAKMEARRAEMQAKKAEMMAKREARQTEMQAKKAEVQANMEARRAEMEAKKAEMLKKRQQMKAQRESRISQMKTASTN